MSHREAILYHLNIVDPEDHSRTVEDYDWA